MAALELLAGATWAKVIAARNGYLVDQLSRIADGFSTWSTAGKPVRMNVARGGGDQVNEGLMFLAAASAYGPRRGIYDT